MAYNRKDHYYQKAKNEGKASRASFKLSQLNDKLKIIKKSDRVIDLGSWPGGWMEEASIIVGEKGKIAGVDLVEITSKLPKNCSFFRGDILEDETALKLTDLLGSKADTVISDVSPKLTGVSFRDNAKWEELANAVIDIAIKTLKEEGNLIIKAFTSQEAESIKKSLKKHFTAVKSYKPEASRKESKEFYIIAINFSKNLS